ncbi:MAG: hypothetical protein DHS20C07_29420 [Methyloligella sp.]|nr:MAG: hypothetical protein DHS20C07_29420 [Methyloligella sp.]
MSNANELSISSLFDAIKKSWMKMVLLSLLCALGTFFLANSMAPRYVSEARVLVAPVASYQNPVAGRNPETTLVDKASIFSQIQVIQSRDILAKVVDEYGFLKNEDFLESLKSKTSGILSMIKNPGLPKYEDMSDAVKREFAIDMISLDIQVVPLAESRVIGIRYHSSDAKETEAIANGLAKAYIEWQRSEKVLQSQDDSIRLARLIDDFKKEVKASEAAVAEYRAKKGIFKSSSSNVTLDRQQLTELNSRIIAARERRADSEIRAKLVREMLERDGEVANATETTRSPQIQRLFEQRGRIQRSLAELGATLLSSHPRLIQVRSELRGVNFQIRTEMRRIVRTMENDAKIARAREQSLVKSLNDLKNQSTQTDGDEIQLRALEREARTNRDLLNTYLARFRDAQARKDSAIAPAYATIVSKAHVPSLPYFPRPLSFSLLIFAAMFLVSMALVILRAVISEGEDDETSEQEQRKEGTLGKEADAEA